MKDTPLYEVRKIRDLRDMLRQSTDLYGDQTAFMIKRMRGGPYENITMREFANDVDALGTALLHQVSAGSRVAILAETRYEWYLSYLGVTNGTGIVVPLDKELPGIEIASMLNRAEVDLLIYSKSKQDLIDEIRADIPGVKKFIAMDPPKEKSTLYFWDLLKEGRRLLAEGDRTFLDAPIDPEAMTILLFTSGTTARAKAVMLSQRNICANLEGMCSMLYIGPGDTFLSVLPLHHTYECTCGFLCQVYRGCTIAVCEGLLQITQNIKESKPTMILVVPLMLEMFHRAIMKKAKATKKLARKFEFGLRLTRFLRLFGIDLRRKIFAPVHESFGGNLRMLISGGAAIDPRILRDMQDLGIAAVQGYGLTECAPILALNRDIYFKDHAAGLPLPGVEMKVVDPDEDGIGELAGRGPNVMLGYYKRPDLTAKAIMDGWFHTGDLGFVDDIGWVYITGRKKNVIVTKTGKNIYPEELEGYMQHIKYIEEVLVHGVEREDDTVIGAQIRPNYETIYEEFGEGYSEESIFNLLKKAVSDLNDKLPIYKHIREITIRADDFVKTTTKKIKRHKSTENLDKDAFKRVDGETDEAPGESKGDY